jgi:hypothetical protein
MAIEFAPLLTGGGHGRYAAMYVRIGRSGDTTDQSINFIVPPAWQHIRAIRQHVAKTLRDCTPDLRDAAVMTAAELLENSIKYGEEVQAAPHILFSMTSDGKHLKIEVANGARNTIGVRELQGRIDELSRPADKAALYLARVEELLAQPSDSSKLGLYRIAFEGQFELACRYEDEVVTVTATRRLQ